MYDKNMYAFGNLKCCGVGVLLLREHVYSTYIIKITLYKIKLVLNHKKNIRK